MNISEIEQLSSKTYLIIATVCMSTIVPGIIYLYIFERGLFISLDFFKTLLLSIALTSPILGINFILSAILSFKKGCPGGNLLGDLLILISTVISSVSFIISILITYIMLLMKYRNLFISFVIFLICELLFFCCFRKWVFFKN